MKSVLQVKLNPTEAVKSSLLRTMEAFNAACNFISEEAFRTGTFSKFPLQRLVYHEVKQRFGLSAQLTILAVHKVAAAYKLDKNTLREFRTHGAMTYDERVLRFKGMGIVSLWTVDGRKESSVIMGNYQKARWFQVKGQADLVLVDHVFYLLVTSDVPEDTPIEPKAFIGVDLGIVNIATTSDGNRFCGKSLEKKRKKYLKLRAALQKKRATDRQRPRA